MFGALQFLHTAISKDPIHPLGTFVASVAFCDFATPVSRMVTPANKVFQTESLQKSYSKHFPTYLQIFIGPLNELRFRLPTHILCCASGVIHEAVLGDWVESIPNELIFPTIDPDTWKMFIQWIYTGKKALEESNMVPTNEKSTDIVPWVCISTGEIVMGARDRVTVALIECYLLGDFLESPAFQNDTKITLYGTTAPAVTIIIQKELLLHLVIIRMGNLAPLNSRSMAIHMIPIDRTGRLSYFMPLRPR